MSQFVLADRDLLGMWYTFRMTSLLVMFGPPYFNICNIVLHKLIIAERRGCIS